MMSIVEAEWGGVVVAGAGGEQLGPRRGARLAGVAHVVSYPPCANMGQCGLVPTTLLAQV